MTALQRLEDTYLAILRVFFIVIATIALVASIFAGLGASSLLFKDSKAVQPQPTVIQGDSFSDYKRERSPSSTGGVSAPGVALAGLGEADINGAVSEFNAYVQKKFGQPLPNEARTKFKEAFESSRDSLPADVQVQYAASLRKLLAEAEENGSINSLEEFGSLVDWHHERFKQAADATNRANIERQAKADAAKVKAFQSLWTAAGAMAAFLMIVFCFLLVRIERNLRIVQTRAI